MGNLFGSIMIAIIPLLWLGGIVWVIYDAEDRERSGCLIGLLVLMTGPLGLLIWFLARPARKT